MGDQGYLDELAQKYDIYDIQHLGANLAPWSQGQYTYHEEGGRIYVDDDRLLFYHFHEFRHNDKGDVLKRTGYRLHPFVAEYIYPPYEAEIKAICRGDDMSARPYVALGEIMSTPVDGKAHWLDRNFASAQYTLVSDELRRWNQLEVYQVFLNMLWQIPDRGSLLDIGCGVGGYGQLCKTAFPKMAYTGTDISPHMIEFAGLTCPTGTFRVCDFFDNDLEEHDIVLTASAIECTPDPWGALAFLLENASNYIVLHRLHLTTGETREFSDPSYCGERISKMHWNCDELCDFINAERHIVLAHKWWHREMLTVVVGPKSDGVMR